ncbi:PilT/PilU family type 4a pilus ATPase [bacterium]|nr:PilT/PilU family type 4a pilus ATPase [bacterium]
MSDQPKPAASASKNNLHKILELAVQVGASDIHLKPGKGVVFRVNGKLLEVEGVPELSAPDVAAWAKALMNEHQIDVFRRDNEIDLAYSVPGMGRFRANVYRQRGSIAIAMRTIPYSVGTFQDLSLPPVLEQISNERRGLVLVTGSTGSGKSTTLASLVNHINSNRTAHIVTIEDPIEFLLKDQKSMIAQREVGFDTKSFLAALRAALRQDPDVILVGEMRDAETITTTLMAAETGHLVLATLHTTDVMETIHRVLSYFDGAMANQVRYQFATVLRAIICQRLLPRADGKGRVPAVEVLRHTSRIEELLKNSNRTAEIRDAVAGGYATYGMQTFDMALMKLVLDKKVSYQEALDASSNPADFALKFKGISSTADTDLSEFQRLSSQDKEKPAPPSMVIERFSK